MWRSTRSTRHSASWTSARRPVGGTQSLQTPRQPSRGSSQMPSARGSASQLQPMRWAPGLCQGTTRLPSTGSPPTMGSRGTRLQMRWPGPRQRATTPTTHWQYRTSLGGRPASPRWQGWRRRTARGRRGSGFLAVLVTLGESTGPLGGKVSGAGSFGGHQSRSREGIISCCQATRR